MPSLPKSFWCLAVRLTRFFLAFTRTHRAHTRHLTVTQFLITLPAHAAFFMEATYEVIIDPRDIPGCCPPGQPPMYPPISSGDYLVQKYRETHASFEGPPDAAVDQPVNGHAGLEGPPKTAVDTPENGHASET